MPAESGVKVARAGQPGRAGLGRVASSFRGGFGGWGWRWLEAALIAVLAVQSARLLWALVVPVGPLGAVGVSPAPAFTFDPVLAVQAFGPGSAGVAAADTSGLMLMGIRRDRDAGRSSAIMSDAGGPQQVYGVGDPIRPGLRLQAVSRDHVLVSGPGGEFRLHLPAAGSTLPTSASMPPPIASPQPSGGSVDARQLAAEAGLRARLRNGRVEGYTLIPRGSGQALRSAGLQAGDVLLSVNGEQLTPERVAELGQLLQSAGGTELTVQRGDETKTIMLHTEQP